MTGRFYEFRKAEIEGEKQQQSVSDFQLTRAIEKKGCRSAVISPSEIIGSG